MPKALWTWLSRHVLARYVIIGGLSYIVEMGTLYILRQVFGLAPVVAVAISFWVGFVVAFLLQKFVTFQNRHMAARVVAQQVIAYSLLTAWNYSFTLVAVWLFAGLASVFVIRTVTIIIITSWNFVVYRRLFSAVPSEV